MMHWNTVTPRLRQALERVMDNDCFDSFRLVGGTALSLQLGHRESIDIDLFTDADYGTIDFKIIDRYFRKYYRYVDTNKVEIIGMGTSWYIGNSEDELIKIDVYHTDKYIRAWVEENNIRMASPEDIIAMKLEIVGSGGRKKDFWDLHALAGKTIDIDPPPPP